MTNNRLIKLLIADDHPVFRSGLKGLIETDPQLEVVGEASSGMETLEKVLQLQAHVIVLDIDMPNGDGFEVAQKLRDLKLPLEIIFLTMHKDEHYFYKALELNVKGYLLKESAATDIINGIKTVAEGKVFISPAISDLLSNRAGKTEQIKNENSHMPEILSPTERRILALLAGYKTSRAIAETLGVSFRTIESHRVNIARKLGLKGNHALVKYAAENRLSLK